MQSPVLVTGATGMLGKSWAALLTKLGVEYTVTSRNELNLLEPATIDRVLTSQYHTVVNCAAWTDVDGAETDEQGATQVNGHSVGRMAELCEKHGAKLVTYSTDYVFNGHADSPYRTDEPRNPINAYGRSKAVGEQLLEQSGCDYLLIRTSWVYAPWGKNFVRTIAKAAKARDMLKVVADQRGRPTSAEHLAQVSHDLLQAQARGIFHVTDGGACTWYDFARQIAAFANPDCKVEPCTSAEYPRPAKRPAYSVLDLAETEALVGEMPAWEANLAVVLRRLEPLS